MLKSSDRRCKGRRQASTLLAMADAACDLSLAQRDSYCRRSTSRVLSCAAAADGAYAVVVDDT